VVDAHHRNDRVPSEREKRDVEPAVFDSVGGVGVYGLDFASKANQLLVNLDRLLPEGN